MSYSAREEIIHMKGTAHGGLDYSRMRKEGVEPSSVLDFSVSTNPFGPSPRVLKAMANAVIERYPDPLSGELVNAVASYSGVEPSSVLITNGLAQAIWLIAFSFLRKGEGVLICGPTFGEYHVSSSLMGARIIDANAGKEQDFIPSVEDICSIIEKEGPSLVWICNPNNPTGALLGRAEVESILSVCFRKGALLVLDEAYMNFSSDSWNSTDLLEKGDLIIMKSMTKDFALTGLRLGYILSSSSTKDILSRVQPAWSINAPAQEGGKAALEDIGYYSGTWSDIIRLTVDLETSLKGLGYNVYPTEANFLLMEIGNVAQLKEHLWKDRILVRDCTSFGLEGYIRIGIKKADENRRLLHSLEQFQKEGDRWDG